MYGYFGDTTLERLDIYLKGKAKALCAGVVRSLHVAQTVAPVKLGGDVLVRREQQTHTRAVDCGRAWRISHVPGPAIIEKRRQMHNASSGLVEEQRQSKLHG